MPETPGETVAGERTGGQARHPAKGSRMPEGSRFYEQVVPALLILLGIGTLSLILFAAGVLLGIVPFN